MEMFLVRTSIRSSQVIRVGIPQLVININIDSTVLLRTGTAVHVLFGTQRALTAQLPRLRTGVYFLVFFHRDALLWLVP